jgi:hypothetical protein
MGYGKRTRILRTFGEARAREFWVDLLCFQADWEHRFESGLPLFMRVSRDGCVLHLSQHDGDCSPGASIRVVRDDFGSSLTVLATKRYRYARPGSEEMPWGTSEMEDREPCSSSRRSRGCMQHSNRRWRPPNRSADGKALASAVLSLRVEIGPIQPAESPRLSRKEPPGGSAGSGERSARSVFLRMGSPG